MTTVSEWTPPAAKTTNLQVCKEFADEIRQKIASLRQSLDNLEEALGERTRALEMGYVEPVMRDATSILYTAGRLNGAVLVRSVEGGD